jgi:hypothetical protein
MILGIGEIEVHRMAMDMDIMDTDHQMAFAEISEVVTMVVADDMEVSALPVSQTRSKMFAICSN